MRLPLPALALAAVLLLAAGAQAQLRSSLAVFFDMTNQDSVVALTQMSETALEVEFVDLMTTERRTKTEEVGLRPMERLLAQARAEGVEVKAWNPSAGGDRPASETPAALGNPQGEPGPGPHVPGPARSASSQRKNRIQYMGWQVPMTTWIYGSAIPVAFDVEETRVHVAMPLLVAPVAFGAHLWFAKSRPFEDAHFLGTRYLTLLAMYSSYALPFALIDTDDGEPFRTAAIVSLAAYPLGLWGGYMLGDRYVDMPGRVTTQSNFAAGFGALGFFTPFLYFDDFGPNEETIWRLGLGQSVATGLAGHFLSHYYRAGENIPGGVTTGVLNHAALGTGVGVTVAALSDAEQVRPWIGGVIAGGTLGFMEGLWYYRKRYDTQERGFYNALGTVAGLLMGAGVLVLVADDDASDYSMKVTTTSLLTGGALMGYIATDLLTMGMEEKGPGASARPAWTDRLAFNPLPVPEPTLRQGPAGREIDYRYRFPGLSWRF